MLSLPSVDSGYGFYHPPLRSGSRFREGEGHPETIYFMDACNEYLKQNKTQKSMYS